MSYVQYTPTIQMADDVNNWGELVTKDVDMAAIGFGSEPQRGHIGLLLRNTHETTTGMVKDYIDKHVEGVSDWMNEAFEVTHMTQDAFREELKSLRQIIETQAELLRAYKAQLD